VNDMRVTIEKKTDQLNYEDFLHGVTRTVTIVEVRKGSKEQQYDIVIEGDTRFWRPAVTVLKLLVEAWGDNAREWVGRRATLYGDPTVTFGRDVVGGIRVSHLSHIEKPVTANLTVTRGKRAKHTVEPLVEAPKPTPEPIEVRAPKAVEWFAGKGVPASALEAHVSKPVAEWTHTDMDALMAARDELTGGQS
jgi:hypothetical protein